VFGMAIILGVGGEKLTASFAFFYKFIIVRISLSSFSRLSYFSFFPLCRKPPPPPKKKKKPLKNMQINIEI